MSGRNGLGLILASAAALVVLFRTAWSSPPAAEPQLFTLSGDIEGVHDPAAIRDGGTYYVLCTGGGRGGQGIIPIRSSTDLEHWNASGFVLDKLPQWATTEIPRGRGAWAPDISYYRVKYHVYYAVSSFGSRNSAIGLATNQTLDPKSPKYKWLDEGMVLRSYEEKDDWNAIDPNLVVEDEQHVWLDWGSFWGGIKMRRIDPATGKLSGEDEKLYSLAARPRTPPIGGSIEAPFIVRHASDWYLFASFDRCCRGAQSTYNVVVGRSSKITGPYVDRTGKPMMEGGGTVVIEATTPNWRGPGHEAVLEEPGRDLLFFHAYHGTTGRPYLQISTILWEDGWPHVATLP